MLEIASQMILCLLLAALIGAIIGYLFGKSTCNDDCGHKEDEENKENYNMHASSAAAPTVLASNDTKETYTALEADKPVLLSGPRNGQKDNLSRIKGIGVKIEETLNNIGVYHFDQIAGWNEENIAWSDSTLGFPGRAKRELWVSQATALAAGEETEFSKRVDKGEVSSSKQS